MHPATGDTDNTGDNGDTGDTGNHNRNRSNSNNHSNKRSPAPPIDMEKEHKITLSRICASIVLLATAALTEHGIIHPSATESVSTAICVTIYALSYIVIGGDIVFRAIRNIFHGEIFDENFLMAVATIGAFATGQYPEAVAVMLFYQIGEMFQDIAVERSKESISALMDIRPDYANLENEDGSLTQVGPDKVPTGSSIVVKPGEKIPLDGVITDGTSTLDTSALTGESLPSEVGTGHSVLSGSLNMTGLLKIRTTGAYAESTVAKIIDLVENAETGKARTEKFITKFARYYTPAVVGAAVLLALIPPLFLGGWLTWLNRALIFLVISCPCALVVSIPLTFFAGIGGASRKGILIKGSNYLEALAKTGIVVMDKTGTLTEGKFSVTEIIPADGHTEEELLSAAAHTEVYSEHPIAAALRKAFGKEPDRSKVTDLENIAGKGLCAVIDGKKVLAGNSALMEEAGIKVSDSSHAGTIVHVASGGEYLGQILISDTIKPQSAEAIKSLRTLGVGKTVMLTGDRQAIADEVAAKVGIDEVHAGLLPADKVGCVKTVLEQKSANETLAFVGDGINDAPVLKIADVGIAMGAIGSDAAIAASDVVLMDDNPQKIADAISLSRRTMGIAKQNIAFAIGVKLIFLLLAALGVANMWEAVFADVGVTVIAVLNSLRAMRG